MKNVMYNTHVLHSTFLLDDYNVSSFTART